MKKVLLIVLCSLVYASAVAQAPPTFSLIAASNSKKGWVNFIDPNVVNPNTLFTVYKSNFGLAANDSMRLDTSSTDIFGVTHTYYQQYYKNVKVENCQFIVHSRNLKSEVGNGKICRNFSMSVSPAISATAAINFAKTHVGATTYMWEDSLEEAQLKEVRNDVNITYYPTPELLIAMTGIDLPYKTTNFKLAYKINIFSKLPFDAKTIYIDANTGSFIREESLIHACNPSVGSAATLYSGTKTINTSYNAGTNQYKLHNVCKGGGILTHYNGNDVYSSNNNSWTTSTAANQVQWGTETYYDFLFQKFNRKSIDNNNLLLWSNVDMLTNVPGNVGAYFNFDKVTFQTKVGNTYYGIAYCPTDVIGHEWTHGLSKYAVQGELSNSGESGGINEGISDVFGVMLEFFAEGTSGDWTTGEDFYTVGGGISAFGRDLSSPMSGGIADTYYGVNYDANEVHNMSGIVGYWFYLLSVGGSGSNHPNFPAIPENYNVLPIGKDAALQLLYHSYPYLTRNAQFYDMRRATLLAAIHVFGSDCSYEANQIAEAWDAVGVYEEYPDPDCAGLLNLRTCIEKTITGCNPITASASIYVTSDSPLNLSYAWMDDVNFLSNPGAATANVTDLAPGTYSCMIADIDNAACEYTVGPIHIYPETPVSITAVPDRSDICQGECAKINVQGATTYYVDGVAVWSNPIPVCPTTNTTYQIKGKSIDGCSTDTKNVTINVHQPLSISVAASTQSICTGKSSVITASGANTYVLSPGSVSGNPFTVSPSASTTYYVTGTNSYGCTAQKAIDISVDPAYCCGQGNAFTATNGNISGAGGIYNLNSPLTLTGDMTLSNLTIFMGVNAEIIIPNNRMLTLNSVHFLGCPIMWKGIRCSGTSASIVIGTNTLIEDAITGIDLKNVTTPKTGQSLILDINSSTFNKNYTSINFENYSNTNDYPAQIIGSVFTCRSLITSDHTTYLAAGATTYNWNTGTANSVLKTTTYDPSTPAVMATGANVNVTDQFSAANFPSATLSKPNQGKISRNGILVNNVAAQSSGSTYGFSIGNTGTTYATLNLFDNLNIGINSVNSNLKSSNCGYQHMSQYTYLDAITGLIEYGGGIGIKSETTLPNVQNKLDVKPNSGNNFDKSSNFFFNNCSGIYASGTASVNIQFALVHCGRIYTSNTSPGVGGLAKGDYGIYVTANTYPKVLINNNYITNVNTGIYFASKGIVAEQQNGSSIINFNYLQSDYTGAATNRALKIGIIADNLFSCTGCTPGGDVMPIVVSGNIIKNAFRGIKSSNWKHKICVASENIITLKQEPNNIGGSQTTQYGILHENNNGDIINSNTVTGFGINKTLVYAIRAKDNFSQTMYCNSTSNTYEGFTFLGAQNTVTWQKNTMESHVRGMHLNNTVIGQQGSATLPMENFWLTTGAGWAGTNYQTFVTSNNATTYAVNSILYVANNITNNPSNNSGLPASQKYIAATSILMASGANHYTCPQIGNPGTPGERLNPNTGNNLEHAMVKIIEDSVGYNELELSKKITAKQSIFASLKKDKSLMNGNIELQAFYDKNVNGNMNALMNVENSLSNKNYNEAATLNNHILAENKIEANSKYLYDLYLKFENNTYTKADNDQLFLFAGGCPDREGTVIYQARTLFNIINNIYYNFEDSCEIQTSKKLTGPDFKTDTEYSLSIFPNPGNRDFTIDLSDKNITYFHLKLYDIHGKGVYEIYAETKNLSYNLNIPDLHNGIYFIELTDDINDIRYKQKLIIQK